MSQTVTSIDVPPEERPQDHDQGFFTPDITMMILTWITFFILLAVLKKYAWRPILKTLDTREESIRKSLDEVDRIHEEKERIEETRHNILQVAEKEATEIIEASRKAAQEAAKVIQAKAKDESQIILANASREIAEEKQKAQAELHQESVHIAVALAGKIIEENLDEEKNRQLIDQFMKEI